ncbi:S8 family serine peptidase [Paracoccus sp. T5]|uniref:S8 family serine peptidase n=1 Tax=Paracoccus sp. T5 TaxID=3402161 RepID=UPI003AD8590C
MPQNRLIKVAAAVACLILSGAAASAQDLQPWMSPEIADAWTQGYKGQGSHVTVVDDFKSRSRYWGQLEPRVQRLRHGQWTAKQVSLMAPSARVKRQDFGDNRAIKLRRGLNIFNLSYGMMAVENLSVRWNPRERSIIKHAQGGRGVAVKAAGNDAIPIGAVNSMMEVDYLARDLVGAASAIFVGALDAHGRPDQRANLASYSNYAGDDAAVQSQFLVVGVTGAQTGLYGTSFAVPIVSGYSAVLSSKFPQATPAQVASQLLSTARTDTINNYTAATHGRGEASIARALAPVAIR